MSVSAAGFLGTWPTPRRLCRRLLQCLAPHGAFAPRHRRAVRPPYLGLPRSTLRDASGGLKRLPGLWHRARCERSARAPSLPAPACRPVPGRLWSGSMRLPPFPTGTSSVAPPSAPLLSSLSACETRPSAPHPPLSASQRALSAQDISRARPRACDRLTAAARFVCRVAARPRVRRRDQRERMRRSAC